MCWLGIFYFFIKTFDIKLSGKEHFKIYEDAGLSSRFSYFESWRQYENVHIVCWIGKDYAWLTENRIMWVIFTIPTIMIAIDFVISTGYAKNMIIDHCYYISQFLWVSANVIWAYGELFIDEKYDDPSNIFEWNDYTQR